MTSEALQSTEILRQIRAQLEPDVADELVFYASDDSLLFSATALSMVRSGTLNLETDLVGLLTNMLRETH